MVAGDGVADGGGSEDAGDVARLGGPVQNEAGEREAGEPVADDEELGLDDVAAEVGVDLEVVLVDGPGVVDHVATRQRPRSFDGALAGGVVLRADADGLGDVLPRLVERGVAVVVEPVPVDGTEGSDGVVGVAVGREERDFRCG